jgi:amidophosphoribosyltransferase
LIANGRDADEIAKAIGADAVFYQELADLIEDVRACNPHIKAFDASCFDGRYITGGVSAEYLDALEHGRGKGASDAPDLNDDASRAEQLDLGLSVAQG